MDLQTIVIIVIIVLVVLAILGYFGRGTIADKGALTRYGRGSRGNIQKRPLRRCPHQHPAQEPRLMSGRDTRRQAAGIDRRP